MKKWQKRLIGIKFSIKDTTKHDFMKHKIIRAFGANIKNGDITMNKASNEQNKLTQKVEKFKSNTKPRNSNMIKKIKCHK